MSIEKYKKLSKDYKTNEYLEDVLTEYENHFKNTLEEDERLIVAFNNVFYHLKKTEPQFKEQKSHIKKQLKSVISQLDELEKEAKDIRQIIK